MIKVILDTNVLLSALVFGGVPQKVVSYCFDSSEISVYLSQAIWNEINEKFLGDRVTEIAKKSKRDITRSQIEQFLELIYDNTTCINPEHKFEVCRDSKDNMFLDLAFACQVDFLISGDKDLLSIGTFEGTYIILPSVFLATKI
jgi:uncharacterized protein